MEWNLSDLFWVSPKNAETSPFLTLVDDIEKYNMLLKQQCVYMRVIGPLFHYDERQLKHGMHQGIGWRLEGGNGVGGRSTRTKFT